MNKKPFILSILILIAIAGTNFPSAKTTASSTLISTDPSNDVFEWSWDSGTSTVNWQYNVSKPSIDMTGIYYGLNNNGNATVTLSFVGTPTLDNYSVYYALFTNDNITVLTWAGGYISNSSSNTYCLLSCSYISTSDGGNNFGIGYANGSAVVNGNNLTWTLPQLVDNFNFKTLAYENVSANLTATPNPTWDWSAWAWTGTNLYDYNYTATSGNWWEDELSVSPSSSSTNSTGSNTNTNNSSGNSNTGSQNTSTNSSSSIKSSPGLEVIPTITILSVVSFLVIIQRRQKNFR